MVSTTATRFGAECFGELFGPSRAGQEMLQRVETRLLLLASSLRPSAQLGQYVEQAIDLGIDWSEFQRLLVAHRLVPFVAKSLGSLDEVPSPVRDALASAARQCAMRSLKGVADARRAQIALQAAGVPSMILKGPALAEMVYGDPAARMFVDIDLFVAPPDISQALEVMRGLGYEPLTWAEWTSERLDVAIRAFHAHDVELQPVGAGLRVELHWRAMGHSSYDRTEAALIAALSDQDSESARVAFATQVLIHGARHGYRRLGWLRDAGALSASLDDHEWESVLRLADADHVPNTVLLGPYLAHRLFGAPVPVPVAGRIDERCKPICELAGNSMMTRPDHPGIEERGALKMQLLLRDRKRDRARYLGDKLGRLDRGQMSEATLSVGPRGSASRGAAQASKFANFASGRLLAKAKRSISTRRSG